jgi:hypothetical protein
VAVREAILSVKGYPGAELGKGTLFFHPLSDIPTEAAHEKKHLA